ncbi:cell wall protein DAN4-like [Daphnia pulex]|uniref:cell wall protein DAN4-like n=1 Tax=Daphnia pulex TaxID=6669 RepID=UPI001EDF9A9F|nr:cell wall protein DAN4-like [Daphnia pulex]
MKLFPIVFLLAVAAGEALDEICNSRKTTTNLIARRTWPSQIASTTAKPTTDTTTASPKSTTTAESSTVSTTAPTTTTTTAVTSTTSIPSTTTTKSSSTMSSTSTTTMATTTTPLLILFNCSVTDPECGTMCTNLTSTGGVVQSPNYPGDYGNEERRCEVSITAPAGWMIQLKFTAFNVEKNVAAVFANDGTSSVMTPTSGNTIPDLVPTAVGMMRIFFQYYVSSKPITATYNWQATFSVTSQGSLCSVENPACGNMCTNVTPAGNGVVQSPNFPADYGSEYKNCQVSIVVPAGKRIRLEFTTFNLETDISSILVSDKSALYLPWTTGNTIPPVVTTSSNILLMKFFTKDSTKPNAAIYNWKATYTAV